MRQDDVNMLVGSADESDQSPLALVATAMTDNQFWKDCMQHLHIKADSHKVCHAEYSSIYTMYVMSTHLDIEQLDLFDL